jgi:hypothetical protein
MPSARAQELLAARARRVRAIRRWIAAAVVAAFLLAWVMIARDGSLGTTTAGASVAPTSAPASGDDATPWFDGGASAGDDAAGDPSGTLTTGQS